MRPSDSGQPVRLSEYRVPDYFIDHVELDVSLDIHATRVVSTLSLRPNPAGRPGAALALDGDELMFVSARLDGEPIDAADFEANPSGFLLPSPPRRAFTLTIETRLDPAADTKLMGLYRTGSAYCTQCEAEGFRRITYFLDRPDVLATYSVRIDADRGAAPRSCCPTAISRPRARRRVRPPLRHLARSAQEALLSVCAGRRRSRPSSRIRSSPRRTQDVALAIYVEHGREERARYAMDALKRSMAWDEQAYGREYDLDVFNIVAVSDFNMGAMENKGLNVFNDKYVLASPETATDDDYAGIESVIAHEYFHNWTGDRVTCRDWFQLCLKEGLTVFRDQEFSADMRSAPVKRIVDVRTLRAAQFPEDAGPLAHNVRPEVYHEINNFYTATVYQKGAEVVRMMKRLIGAEAFRNGMDLYFERYDGHAATVEDFVTLFRDVSGSISRSSSGGTLRPARRQVPVPAPTSRQARPSTRHRANACVRRRASRQEADADPDPALACSAPTATTCLKSGQRRASSSRRRIADQAPAEHPLHRRAFAPRSLADARLFRAGQRDVDLPDDDLSCLWPTTATVQSLAVRKQRCRAHVVEAVRNRTAAKQGGLRPPSAPSISVAGRGSRSAFARDARQACRHRPTSPA